MWPGPYGEWGSRKYLMASLDQSLKRMGLDYVDIFYSHRPDPETPVEETMGTLADIVRQGKALYIGISNYNAEQTACALAALKTHNVPCLIHQAKYSMLERWSEPALLPLLEKEGIGLIAFSPLAQGLLTSRYLNGIPEDSRAARSSGHLQIEQVNPAIEKVRRLNKIAIDRGQSLAEMALAWLLKDIRVTSVLIGASSVLQLMENLKATQNIQFTKDEITVIENILNNKPDA
jgi:L-glyceraldehyde 3-phosphate reductase